MEAVITAEVQLINHRVKKAHSTGAAITIRAGKLSVATIGKPER